MYFVMWNGENFPQTIGCAGHGLVKRESAFAAARPNAEARRRKLVCPMLADAQSCSKRSAKCFAVAANDCSN